MFQKQHKTGLRTIFFPSINQNDEKITLKIAFATPIKFGENQSDTIRDIYHTFSASHLIEHTLIEQSMQSFDELDQKFNATMENAFTSYNLTYYVLHIKNKNHIGEAVRTTLHNLMNQPRIDKDALLHELEIIKHEFKDDYFDVNEETVVLNKHDLLEKKVKGHDKKQESEKKQTEKEKQLEASIIQNRVTKLEDYQKVSAYYKKKYTPENTIITIDGGNKKTYEQIVRAIDVFFQDYPQKDPKVYDFTEDTIFGDIDNFFERDDEFYNKLFSKKYYIFPLKDKKATYSQTRVYFKVPKNKKFVLATKLLMAVAYKQIATSTILTKNLRAKEKLVYGIMPLVDILENSHKYALSLTFKTESKNIKTALTALRDTINEMATTGTLNTNDFAREKQTFAKQYYDDAKYFFVNDDFEDMISLIYSDKKLNSIERDVRLINDLKLEDLINAAKFLAKSNQFTIQCFGNNLALSDLEAFSKNMKNPYSQKDLNHFFGGNEKIEEYQNNECYDAKDEIDKDVPVIDL